MLITIPDLLTKDQVAQARARLNQAEWVDGKVTAGYQAQTVKKNAQIPEGHPIAKELGDAILAALARSPLFMSVALPLRVFPPMFNSYAGARPSAPTSIPPSAPSAPPASASAPISPAPSSSPSRKNTTVASSTFRTPTAPTASNFPPARLSFIPPAVSTPFAPSPAEPASAASSGSRA